MDKKEPEAKLLKEIFPTDLESARRAILELYSQSVLLLAFGQRGSAYSIRSGLYASLGGVHFVVTAGHQLDGLHLDDFTYQSRPAEWRGPEKGPGQPNASWIPIPDRHVEDRELLPEPQDLLVMRIKPLPHKGGKVVPYPLDHCPPYSAPPSTKTVVLGFPGALRADVNKDPFTFKPLGLWSHVVEKPPGVPYIHPEFHFLTRYKLIKGDPMFGNSTEGMSGAPVFVVPPNEKILVPGLLGIQHLDISDKNLLKATRIEHVIPLVQKLLARCR